MATDQTPNHLINEKSPYLRQHAYNPVDWYPWGTEGLALAKKLNKPIFLSIGYSTCHWCHVMAHESFENPATAALMNEHFVNIKVDREERPDLDAIYMSAVQALTGSGGWPMSVWLTPELKPFFGGTYFPREDSHGRPGFASVLTQLAEAWATDRDRVLHASNQITELLEEQARQTNPAGSQAFDAKKIHNAVFHYLRTIYDSQNGGFGPAPKFPMPVYMRFLMDYYRRTKDPVALEMVSFTMEKIARGGITDQLGGGFSRYSTDERWIVPHFEKMLYDNAQLISILAPLFETTGDVSWKKIGAQAIGYVLETLRHTDGGFYAAEDADSEGKEGTFYLWTLSEIRKSLEAPEADIIIDRYGVTAHGNFYDPHTRESGQNVLTQTRPMEEDAAPALLSAKKKLLEIRNRRPRPQRDEKIITEWNGLMISALAHAATAFGEPSYREAAEQAARFIEKNLYDARKKILFRSWCDGQQSAEAQQADYAALIQGLLDLYDSGHSRPWLDWAVELQKTQDELFFDPELSGYFMTVPRPDVLIRLKDDNDNVIPSGNSLAVHNGLRLARLTDNPNFSAKALQTVRAFASKLERYPASLAAMAMALPEL